MARYSESEDDVMSNEYGSEDDYKDKRKTRAEIAQMWESRIQAADQVYRAWCQRFKIEVLYQYYEGFQWFFETDENNRPYCINLIFANIETKTPSLLFDNPVFTLRGRPSGVTWDEAKAEQLAQVREDTLNFIVSRPAMGVGDKVELALLDAFFGFGVIETDYSKDPIVNPLISEGDPNPLNNLYVKHIPFDTFRVSARANFDLSRGKWYGYYEFIDNKYLKKYEDKISSVQVTTDNQTEDYEINSEATNVTGKITVGELSTTHVAPTGTTKIWKLWDLETYKFCLFAPEASLENRVLEYKNFEYSPISTLRFVKRRKGWYPLPFIYNWLGPQDEINDIKQAERVHRKRYTRKYMILENAVDPEEEDKFNNLPDGGSFKVKKENAVTPVADAPMQQLNDKVLLGAYQDLDRVAGTSQDRLQVADRQTATQSNIIEQRANVRDSRDLIRVGDFMASFGLNVLRAVKKIKDKKFWIMSPIRNQNLLGLVQKRTGEWKTVKTSQFEDENNDIMFNASSASPIYQQNDKKAFMEFLALITQYEILSLSPDLIQEAAYKVGYKNQAFLDQFQQLAQLRMLGMLNQAKAAVQPAVPAPTGGPQPTPPGTLPSRQVDMSTPPDAQTIMNMIFNRAGLQQ